MEYQTVSDNYQQISNKYQLVSNKYQLVNQLSAVNNKNNHSKQSGCFCLSSVANRG